MVPHGDPGRGAPGRRGRGDRHRHGRRVVGRPVLQPGQRGHDRDRAAPLARRPDPTVRTRVPGGVRRARDAPGGASRAGSAGPPRPRDRAHSRRHPRPSAGHARRADRRGDRPAGLGPVPVCARVDGADQTGRSVAPFGLLLGDWRPLALERTPAPTWSSDATGWRRQYNDQPVRLTLACVREGDEPWTVPQEVRVDQGAPP
jgi:hypothetical protein